MTNKAKIIWISVGAVVVSLAIWLWWRQKDAVPLTANPILQQARASLTGSTAAAPSSTTAATSIPDQLQSLLSSVIPGYVPLTS